MFWGITLESGKKYTQVLQRSFHVTMAALGFENVSNDAVAVLCEINKAQFMLCSLQAGKFPQQALNLIYTEGEEVSFSIEGEGEVHLTGYLLPDPQEYEYSDDEELDEGNEEEEGDEIEEDTEKDFEEAVSKVEKNNDKLQKKKNMNEEREDSSLFDKETEAFKQMEVGSIKATPVDKSSKKTRKQIQITKDGVSIDKSKHENTSVALNVVENLRTTPILNKNQSDDGPADTLIEADSKKRKSDNLKNAGKGKRRKKGKKS